MYRPNDFEPRPYEGLHHPNVVAMVAARVARSPRRTAVRFKRDGSWRAHSWKAYWDRAGAVAAGLAARLGVRPGDRVAVMAHTRVEWALCDLALARLGAISVPIYPTLTADRVGYILDDSRCTVAIVDTPANLSRMLDACAAGMGHTLSGIVYMDREGLRTPGEGGGNVRLEDLPDIGPVRWSFEDVEAAGEAVCAGREPAAVDLDEVQAALRLEDTFSHVYTSGTTGEPKGVVLTHQNFVFESWAIRNVVPVDETDEQLLVLPLAHIFSRHLLWGAVEQGAVTAFAEGPHTIERDLQEVAPTFMGAVPRIYETVYHRVLAAGRSGRLVERRMFDWCIEVGRKVSLHRQRGLSLPLRLAAEWKVADRLVFSRIRRAFGGRLRFFVSGGAPLSVQVAEFFHAAGVLVLEGYGLTETTGAVTVNRPDRYRFGTVGPPMPGCEIRIADDGEILVRGRNVMKAYLGRPEETAEVIDPDGWFHTGDIGEMVGGFLRITDRKKDLFKTSSGKFVAPLMLEQKLEGCGPVARAVVFGEGRPYVVALVELDDAYLAELARREGLGVATYDDLARHPRVRALVQACVDRVNADLASFETIRRFAILPRPLSEAMDEVTPTGKPRRRVVAEHFGTLVDGLYDAPPPPSSGGGGARPFGLGR
ncbi:MAG: long-chain fatty acid--CoA ligase [Deltaproteobacteria bacterium]|nr:MAG: long-chain fatty acid--CoA ligase [Deltaproteobacteria bacterium]